MNSINLNQNKVIVSMGYDNITTNITLASGHGAMLPDVSTPYNLIWWNSTDYLSPTDDPYVEVVKCIAKLGDTLIVMRSQQQTLASPKNIPGKLYNMAYLPDTLHDSNLDTNLNTLSYYNIPQLHGNTKHDATTIDGGISLPIGQLPVHGLSAHTGTIGTWANIDKTTSSIADITTKSHTSLTDIGLNSHATIDSHIAATGISVHGLGTMSTQSANTVSITGGSITGITDITVADGGTGRSTTVPYAPICGGTITTNAMQSVASIGTAGQVLTSNGAGALPTFQTATGGSDRVLKSGDTMTGALYLPANGLVAGTTQLVLYNGNVGIGITNPMYKLDIRGSTLMLANTDWAWGTTGTGMIISGGTTSGNTYLKIDSLNSGGAANGKLVLNVNGGYVGIGITDPTAKLHIGGTAGVDGIKFPDGTLQTTAAASTTLIMEPSQNARNSNDTDVYKVTSSWVKAKSITLNVPFKGGMRIQFVMHNSGANGTWSARIYKNGVAWGTTRSIGANAVWGGSEDFTGLDLPSGTSIELWVVGGGIAMSGHVTLFKLQYDLVTALSSTNATF